MTPAWDESLTGSVMDGTSWRRPERASAQRRREWAEAAANALPETRPGQSAKSGLDPGQKTALLAAALTALLSAAAWPSAFVFTLGAAFALLFATLIALRLAAALFAPRWAPSRRLADEDLPHITVICALYKEDTVAAALVRALSALDYPTDRFDILLATEEADRSTRMAIRAALKALPPGAPSMRLIETPEGEPRTKPRALNFALHFARGEIITVYDAEDRPAPGQLRAAAEAFAAADGELACVQTPLNWYNRDDNWLTRQFALEYAAHFHALLPLFARLGWPLPLGGTSNHFDRAKLEAAGGWDAWNVTEDADLGLRLAAHGWRCDVIAPPTFEEAPARLTAWTRQRTRWLKGHAQTLIVHARRPVAPLPLGLTLGANILSALGHAPLTLVGLAGAGLAALSGRLEALWILAILGAGYLAAAACAAAGMRRAGLRRRWRDFALMPLYWPLQTIAALRALRELAVAPHFWDKTRHGLSPPADDAARPSETPPSPGPAPRKRMPPRPWRSPSPQPGSRSPSAPRYSRWRPGVPACRRTRSRARASFPGR